MNTFLSQLFFLMFFLSCNPTQVVLRVHFQPKISAVDPTEVTAYDWNLVLNQVFDRMFTFDTSGNLKSRIVSDWSNDKNYKKFYFKIRDDIKFHNGKMLDAHDVVYSLSFLRQKQRKELTYLWSSITDIKASDKDRVEITLSRPFSDLPYYLASPSLNIFPKDNFKLNNSSLQSLWVGSGPFKLSKISEGVIELNSFDAYDVKHCLKTILFSNSAEPKKDFLSKKLDFIELSRADYLEVSTNPEFNVSSFPILGSFYLGFNFKNKKFSDLRVRTLFLALIDRSKVVSGVVVKAPYIPSNPIPFGMPGYRPENSDYSLVKARQILSKLPRNLIPTEEDLIIHIPQDLHPMGEHVIQVVNDGLKSIGLPALKKKVVTENYGKGNIGNYYEFLRGGNFNLYLRGMIVTIPSTEYVLLENFSKNGALNFGRYQGLDEKEIMASPSFTYDSEVIKKLSDDVPVIPLGNLYFNPISYSSKPIKAAAISPNYILFHESFE